MARKIRSTELENRGERLNMLAVRKRPYTVRVAKGIRLGYRRTALAGSWVVLKSRGASLTPWTKKFATADDYEESNGSTILTYWEACDMARKLARGEDGIGGETEGGAPLTVAAAVDAYEADLLDRDGHPGNATWLRFHLSGSIKTKPGPAHQEGSARPAQAPARPGAGTRDREPLDEGLRSLHEPGSRRRQTHHQP